MSGLASTLLAIGDTNRGLRWREEDLRQRNIENRQYSLIQKNRLVDLRARNLKGISNLSALIAGFTVVMFVELQIPEDISDALIISYGACSALVCCILSLTTVQTTLMLASISNRSQIHETKQDFNRFWVGRCEDKWRRTFYLFSYAIPLFLLDIILVGWVKFHRTPVAAAVITFVGAVAILMWSSDQCFWGAYLAKSIDFPNDDDLPIAQNDEAGGDSLESKV